MGRLIDADDVKKLLVARYENSELIMKDVDRIKTAYDVEKVVDKLEDIMKDEKIRFADQVVRRAINLVKGGGQG